MARPGRLKPQRGGRATLSKLRGLGQVLRPGLPAVVLFQQIRVGVLPALAAAYGSRFGVVGAQTGQGLTGGVRT